MTDYKLVTVKAHSRTMAFEGKMVVAWVREYQRRVKA